MKPQGMRSEKAGNTQGWWLIPFNALLGGLFLFGCISGAHSLILGIRSLNGDEAEIHRMLNLVAALLDATIASALLGAGALLLMQKRALLFQRAVFWSLLLRCGLVLTELFLPSEGVGGFLLLVALLILVLMTAAALAAALALGRCEKREQAAPVTEEQSTGEQSSVWPPPPTIKP